MNPIPHVLAAPADITVERILNAISSGILIPLVNFLFVLATVVFLYGVIRYVIAQSDQTKISDAKRIMMWGIIGMFIMVSAWGVIRLFCDFFGTCEDIIFPSGGTSPASLNAPINNTSPNTNSPPSDTTPIF